MTNAPATPAPAEKPKPMISITVTATYPAPDPLTLADYADVEERSVKAREAMLKTLPQGTTVTGGEIVVGRQKFPLSKVVSK
jgi:hypothetical protein